LIIKVVLHAKKNLICTIIRIIKMYTILMIEWCYSFAKLLLTSIIELNNDKSLTQRPLKPMIEAGSKLLYHAHLAWLFLWMARTILVRSQTWLKSCWCYNRVVMPTTVGGSWCIPSQTYLDCLLLIMIRDIKNLLLMAFWSFLLISDVSNI